MKNLEQHTETLKNEFNPKNYDFIYFEHPQDAKIVATAPDNIFTPIFTSVLSEYCKFYELEFGIILNDWTKKIQISIREKI